MMAKGVIFKSLSGFYYVKTENGIVTCRARGKFRKDKMSPLVGDEVEISVTGNDGVVDEILPRKNSFIRPPVANIDLMVIFAANTIPVTDPFLLDRIILIAENSGCEPVLCINKTDIDPANELYKIYSMAGIKVLRTSAVTGAGIDELCDTIKGHTCAFTGNSGVGKSSILNLIEPGFALATGEVSEKLGRGRHTTRHVEMFELSCGALAIDTPGFSSFDTGMMDFIRPENVWLGFREFEKHIGCRFLDCSHTSEPDCGVIDAVKAGYIHPSRHDSYVKLYKAAKSVKEWELKK